MDSCKLCGVETKSFLCNNCYEKSAIKYNFEFTKATNEKNFEKTDYLERNRDNIIKWGLIVEKRRKQQ